MKRRNLILLLGGGGSAALSTGTGAFSSATAERGVEVSVVDDEYAYVGYAIPEKKLSVAADERVTLVKIKNQFPSNDGIGVVDVSFDKGGQAFEKISIEKIPGTHDLDDDSDGVAFDDGEWSGNPDEYETLVEPGKLDELPSEGSVSQEKTFGPGNHVAVRAKFVGAESGEIDVGVTVRVRGTGDSGVSAEIFGDTREFTLTCVAPVEGVTFHGAGNASARAGGRTLDAEAWYAEKGADDESGEESGEGEEADDDVDIDDTRVEDGIDWNTSKKLKNSMNGPNFDTSGRLVAVRFPETKQIFAHPNYDVDSNEFPVSWGSGEGQEIEEGSAGEGE